MTLASLLERVGGRTTGPDKGAFRCPAHDDGTASGTLGLGKDGRILVHCQAGCETQAILDAWNIPMRELYAEPPPRKGGWTIDKVYDYVDEAGALLYQVVRILPKDFRQRRPYKGAWAWGLTAGTYEQRADGDWVKSKTNAGDELPDCPRVLYRLPELIAGPDPVFVVEGEKDVDNLRALGFTATCNVGGAGKGKWKPSDTKQLKGRDVVVIPDADEAGALHSATIAAATKGRILRLPGPGKDVSDWIKAGGTAAALRLLAERPEPVADGSTLPTSVTDEVPKRLLAGRSYHSAVTIVAQNRRNVLEGRVLEFDDMTGKPTLNRMQVEDADALRIRYLVEDRFDASSDGKGMKFSKDDIRDALVQVGAERRFHPVREYLEKLHWDGRARIAYFADLIGAERTTLNQALLRRWMVSAVARPLKPGCKVDTVLILVGEQGIGKSTFFDLLADPWFVDTSIDIHSKDAFMTLARAWILEWAELESMLRARDANAVKSFITQRIDTYRRPYGHFVVDVPRTGVIVGTTNNRQFLTDETGSRRFWPISVNDIDRAAIASQRDQLWAEAVHLFRQGVQWWLTEAEEKLLLGIHDEHTVTDAWEPQIQRYAMVNVGFTTADVLGEAIKKPAGQWTKADEMRVGKVLKGLGWELSKKHRSRIWERLQ